MNLRTKINESGKTVTHLAKKLSVSRPTLYKIINDPATATYDQAQTLASELGMTKRETDDIFTVRA